MIERKNVDAEHFKEWQKRRQKIANVPPIMKIRGVEKKAKGHKTFKGKSGIRRRKTETLSQRRM